MTVTIADYINVREKATALGGAVTEKIALIPINFESADSAEDLLQPSEAATVKTLFRINQIPLDDLFPTTQKPRYVQNNGFEWVAPTIFVGSSLMSANPELMSLALDVLASYITDFFKGMSGEKTVKLELIVETSKDYTCKTLRYEGSVSGISELKEEIMRISDE